MGGQLWQSELLFFWEMLKKHWSSGEYPFRSLHKETSEGCREERKTRGRMEGSGGREQSEERERMEQVCKGSRKRVGRV